MTNKSSMWVMFSVLAVALLVAPRSIGAQTTSGTILGVVRDAQQAVVPGASITVRSVETGLTRQGTTDAAGRYRFPQLTPGLYEVQAELTGFRTEVRSGLTLTVASEIVVDFALQVGDVSERIEVTGEAPLVQTTGSTVSSLVNERALQDLPINGRSFIELARLQEGVNAVRTAGGGASSSFGQHLSVSGSNPENNNFMMDGTNISTYQGLGHGGVGGAMPGVEAVKEFRVLTHNFSAEYGRGSGAVINAVSKSGTNGFHGSVYEFLRNDNLDAAQWRDPAKQEFKRNQFGFSVGGPVVQNRTFFFVNYEGLRERLGRVDRPDVPTALTRQGILPNETVTVNPAVLPFLNLYPLPTPGEQDNRDGSAEYLQTYSIPTTKNYVTARIDHNLTQNHMLFVRYTYDTGTSEEPSSFRHLFYEKAHTPLRYGTLELNSLFTPTLLNTFRFGVAKTPTTSDNVALVNVDPTLMLTPGFRMASVTVTNLAGIGPNDALLHIRDFKSLELSDTVSFTRGSHSMKAGFLAQRIINNPTIQTRMGGRFSMTSIADMLRGGRTSPTVSASNPVPNAPNASVEYAPPESASPSRRYRQTLWGFFLQDDYQMRSNLTLNLGLRYELVTTLREIDGLFPKLKDEEILTTRRTDIIVSEPGYLSNPDLKNFEPRIGLAYDPFGRGRTSIRAGFGLYHDHIYLSSLAHEFARMHPHNVFNVAAIPYPVTAAEVVSRVPSPAIGNTAIVLPNHPSSMYSIHTTLDIQQQLGSSFMVSAGYRGSRSVHIMGMSDYNKALPINFTTRAAGEPWLFPTNPVPRANSDWEVITYKDTGNDGFYHALSLRAEKRFSSGLQFQTRYTFSKSIDDASTSKGGNIDGPGSIGASTKIAWYDKKADRAISAFDLTHNFTVNSSYQLPIGRDTQGWLNYIVGGWNVSGILSTSSGPPLTVAQGTTAATTARISGTRRPDLVAGRTRDSITSGTTAGCTFSAAGIPGPYDASAAAARSVEPGRELGTANLYLDPCAFSFAPANRWGTVGRNLLRGPGFFNVDFSLAKNWKVPVVSEVSELQFRWELFNMFNHPNLAQPSNSLFVTSGTFTPTVGQVSNTLSTMRQISFGLKFVF